MLKGLKKVVSSFNSSLPEPKTELLNAKDIDKGLFHISNYIKSHNPALKEPVRVVVTGGVLSVLLFRTRDSTEDIDFFHEDGEIMSCIVASQDFTPGDMDNWPKCWINCELLVFAKKDANGEDLYQNSINQKIIIWKSEYLEVYAADLKFQLVGKIVRAYGYWKKHGGKLSGTKRGTQDLDDAISILHMIQKEKVPLSLNEVRKWYRFGRFVEGEPLDYINSHFKERYGYEGIVASSAEFQNCA